MFNINWKNILSKIKNFKYLQIFILVFSFFKRILMLFPQLYL
ncbi:hypothetical protein Calab_3152 [Caldithrix abyssi DSM 13497]|uniref:Uncharacterized protein n=1 Tax=Caldithrix abyssi DSM 13497 TaxID=880073 RepID=H1XUD2_CALAY|nr:hypothetical protein Calab_3152 [Caldithrix abyssi DSM 13497]